MAEASCELCGGTRGEHSSRKHQFVAAGEPETLRLARQSPSAKTTPMRLALESPADSAQTSASVKRLVVMLCEKGIISEKEIVGVLTGEMPRDPHAATDR